MTVYYTHQGYNESSAIAPDNYCRSGKAVDANASANAKIENMNAKRILILLLMWLIPLYPMLAGAAVHQPASMQTQAVQISHASMGESAHDCCQSAQSADHSLKADSTCDAGRCISHCAVSLTDLGAITPVQIAFVHAPPSITPLSSITLETPFRPPSLV